MEGKNWYALHVTTGFERHARDDLLERISNNGMADRFGEILLPTEKRLEVRRGKNKELTEKVFPGYLFIQMDMAPECWHLVRRARWVNGFIGGSPDAPRALSEEEISSIRNRSGEGEGAPTFRSRFVVGEQVRIKEGPFSDFNGTVESVNNARERLTVSVMVFGRSTPVELDFEQAEKA